MANKKQITVKLAGVKTDGVVAKVHEATKVVGFQNDKNSIQVTSQTNWEYSVTVKTAKGMFYLYAHKTIENLWTGITGNGIKTHFSKKKVVATLRYWA